MAGVRFKHVYGLKAPSITAFLQHIFVGVVLKSSCTYRVHSTTTPALFYLLRAAMQSSGFPCAARPQGCGRWLLPDGLQVESASFLSFHRYAVKTLALSDTFKIYSAVLITFSTRIGLLSVHILTTFSVYLFQPSKYLLIP